MIHRLKANWYKTAAVLLPLVLSACGFQPMYGKHESQEKNALLAGVIIDISLDKAPRLAQMLRINLEDRLNPGGVVPPNPKYRLQASLTSYESAIGVARDGTVSRYNVYLISHYALYRIADDKKIAAGNLRHVSGYNNITNQYFSTYVAQEDAIKRGIAELSESFRQRLGAYLTVNPEGTLSAEAPKEPAPATPSVLAPVPGSVFYNPITPGAPGSPSDATYENRIP